MPKNVVFPVEKKVFWKNSLSMLPSIFDLILVPDLPNFWCQKSPEMRSKINPKRHQKKHRFLDRFRGHLGSILGAELWNCWRHFRLKWGERSKALALFRCVRVYFRFLAPRGWWVPNFWRQGPMGYPIFGRFLGQFGNQRGAILGHLVAIFWAWGPVMLRVDDWWLIVDDWWLMTDNE